MQDITERVESNRLKQQQQEEQASLFRACPAGIAVLKNRKLVKGNDSFFEIVGYTFQEMKDMPEAHSLYRSQEEYDRVGHFYTLATQEGYACTETQFVRKDGTVVDVLLNIAPLDMTDSKKGISIVALDITDRKRAEMRLKESEKRNRAWLENSTVCTKILDIDFNLQYMSHAGIIGLKIKDITEFYGKPYPFDFFPESTRKGITEKLETARETGQIIDMEAPLVDTEGNEVCYHTTIVPVKDEKDRIDYLIVVSTDIT